MKRLNSIVVLVIAVISLSVLPSFASDLVSIGTGGPGGVYYPYGVGLAEIWSKNIPGIKPVAEATAASVENVTLVHTGALEVGLAMGDVVYEGYNGLGKFQGKKHNILGMAAMYPNVMQIVTRKGSGIKNVTDFKGRTVSIGAPGSGTAYMAETVLNTLGIGLDSFTLRELSYNDSANALRDGTIDAGVWVVAPGSASITDLATTNDIEILSFTPEQQAKVCQAYDYYVPWELEGGIYRGVDQPVPTLSVWNVIVVQKDLPEDLVYKLTKTLFAQNAFMRTIHHFARHTTAQNAVTKCPIPLHPGAIRAIEEAGVKVPDKLRP